MTLNRVKLGGVVTYLKYFSSVVSLIYLPKEKNHVSAIKFTKSCRANGKWAYKSIYIKNLRIFLFSIRFILLIVKISRDFN